MKKILWLLGLVLLGVIVTSIFVFKTKSTYAIDDNIVESDNFSISFGDEKLVASRGEKIKLNIVYDRTKYTGGFLRYVSTTTDNKFDCWIQEFYSENPYIVIPKIGKTIVEGETYALESVLFYTDIDSNGNVYNMAPGYYFEEDKVLGNGHYAEVKGNREIEIAKQIVDTTKTNLEYFSLKDSGAFTNEQVYVSLKYYGTPVGINICLRNKETSLTYCAEIKDFDGKNPYFTLSKGLASGEYYIEYVGLTQVENGAYISYTFKDNKYFINRDFEVFATKIENINLVNVSLIDNDTTPGKKVYLDVVADVAISRALLVFYDSKTDKTFSTYVKNLKTNKQYFIVPTMTEAGNYRLQTVIIYDDNGNSQITTVPNYNGETYTDNNGVFYENLYLTVGNLKEKGKSIIFNNEDYNEAIQDKITSLNDDAVITIVCDNNTLVNQELFDIIAGTRKTLILQYGSSEWVFNGTNIVTAKNIDVAMLVTSIEDSDFSRTDISQQISTKNSSILNFSSNGELPGKTLIRLSSESLEEKFGDDEIYIYYYNDGENKLLKVALEVQKTTDNYYEFYINHNSVYILSTEELSKEIISEDESILQMNTKQNITQNQKTENNLNIYIIITIAIVVLILVLLIGIRIGKSKYKIK